MYSSLFLLRRDIMWKTILKHFLLFKKAQEVVADVKPIPKYNITIVLPKQELKEEDVINAIQKQINNIQKQNEKRYFGK